MVASTHARVAAFAAAGLAAALSVTGEAGIQGTPTPASIAGRDAWRRVQLPDPVAGHASRQALDQARRLLAEPRCRNLLAQFADSEGHPLADRLDALGVDVQTYLTMIAFTDGTRHRSCAEGVIAFTRPGSRVVHLCIDALKQTWQQKPTHVVAVFIHEMLHTLGLGENPPPTQEITRRVLQQCREE